MELIKLLATSVFSAVALFATTKIAGHKQMSELDTFDFVSAITVGSIGAELATELEKPYKPFVALLVWFGISLLLSFCERRYPRLRKFLCGTPTIVFYNGQFYPDNMRKAKLDLSEFMLLCRQAGYFDLAEIRIAVFEYNGKISIMPTEMQRPVTPADIGVIPPRDDILTEIIMDGRVMGENLRKSGLNEDWLAKNLAQKGVRSPRDVFLALSDSHANLTIYRYEHKRS